MDILSTLYNAQTGQRFRSISTCIRGAKWNALTGRGKFRTLGPWALPTATMVQVFDLDAKSQYALACTTNGGISLRDTRFLKLQITICQLPTTNPSLGKATGALCDGF